MSCTRSVPVTALTVPRFAAAAPRWWCADGVIVGVESYGYQVPQDCAITVHDGTLLPGLIEAHTHLVADSGVGALGRVAAYSDAQIDEVIRQALERSAASRGHHGPGPG